MSRMKKQIAVEVRIVLRDVNDEEEVIHEVTADWSTDNPILFGGPDMFWPTELTFLAQMLNGIRSCVHKLRTGKYDNALFGNEGR